MIIHASTEKELQEATTKLVAKLKDTGHQKVRAYRYSMLVDVVNVIRSTNNPDEDYISIVEYHS